MAVRLFLNQRSALLKFCLRQQKIEGATLQYIKRMSSVFFNNVKETCKEFQKAFETSTFLTNGTAASTPPSSLVSDTVSITSEKLSPTSSVSIAPAMACLNSWARNQLQHFINLSRHVFTTQVSPPVSAECVSLIRNQCNKLKKVVGIDLLFYLEKQLKTDIERVINECKDKLLEAIKLRSAEDKWQFQNFGNKQRINKFIEDMKENGIGNINVFVYDECRVSLTSNTTSFAKSYINTLKDLLKLSTLFTHDAIVEALAVTFKAQMKHIATSLKQEQFKHEKAFIEKNAAFLLDTLLSLGEHYYHDKFGFNCEELARMHSDYAYLKGGELNRRGSSKGNAAAKYTTYL
jgi:hypothetical protein